MELKNLASNGYHVIASGSVMGFNNTPQFDLELENEDFKISLSLEFLKEENSKESSVKADIQDGKLFIKCYNFEDEGVGLTESIYIAKTKGKEIYFRFYMRNTYKFPVLTYTFFEK